MNMTLAEQLVWAAAYVQEWDRAKNMSMTPLDFKVAMCAQHAFDVVSSMRDGASFIDKDSRSQLSLPAFMYLQQMTCKAKT